MRIVFMGTPEFAVPSLRLLVEHHDVVGIVTQPDRPSGRGLSLQVSPVKQVALEFGIPVLEPSHLADPEALASWAPDVVVVVAFGRILRPSVLNLPKHGCLNVHASLLPKWRGAAPIPAAILAGDRETGVTLMQMDAGMDTGPILAQRSEPIHADDTTASLSARMALLGGRLLTETLPLYVGGRCLPTPQDDRLATYAPSLTKRDGDLDARLPAAELERRVRACDPWPGASFSWKGRRLRVLRARVAEAPGDEVGRVAVIQSCPAVVTPRNALVLEVAQLEGRKPMPGDQLLRGARGLVGALLELPSPASP